MSDKDRVADISLRLWHAELDVGGLLEAWGFTVGRSWIAGEARTTPKGNPLEGRWRESYGYARLPLPKERRLPDCLDHVLNEIQPVVGALQGFVEASGRAELFVGWLFEQNSGDVLDWRLLRRLSDYKLDLSLDIYPPAEAELEDANDGQA